MFLSLNCLFRMGDGHLLKEGADKLRDKYFLEPRKYNRLAPPTLFDTKLFSIQNMEFKGLSEKLLNIHRYVFVSIYSVYNGCLYRDHRNVVKVVLKLWETIASSDKAMAEYTGVSTHYDNPDLGPLPEYTLPPARSFRLTEHEVFRSDVANVVTAVAEGEDQTDLHNFAKELVGRRAQVNHLEKLVKDLLGDKLKDFQVASLGQKLHNGYKEMVLDILTLLGQEDLNIKETRESKLQTYLTRGFTSALKASGTVSCRVQTCPLFSLYLLCILLICLLL